MENIIQKHREIVLRLKKPGAEILRTLTPYGCDLTHMGGCLMGEAAELHDAVVENSSELLEELGDFAFYLVANKDIFGLNEWESNKPNGVRDEAVKPETQTVELMRLGGHFWDVVKRIVVYRKPSHSPDSKYAGRTLCTVAQETLSDMEARFNWLLKHYGYSLEAVLEENYRKLADADTDRFSSGAYSDEQAQERRDKQGRQ